MIYSSKDLEIFIITYNRWELLELSLKSILLQDNTEFKITIIDNGGKLNNKTRDLLVKNNKYRIIRFEKNDQLGIWNKIIKLTKKTWMMIFHDDDILHQSYISSVFMLLNNYPKINVIGCYNKSFKTNFINFNWKIKDKSKHKYLQNEKDLAMYYVKGKPIPFCSLIYRTTKYKQNDFKKLHTNFGKIFDRPLAVESSRNGGALILTNDFVKTRIHENQDSNTIISSQYSFYLLNLIKFYYELLGSNIFSKHGRVFLKNNYILFLELFNWGSLKEYSYNEFVTLGIKNGSTSELSYRLSKFYNLLFNFNLKIKFFKGLYVYCKKKITK